MKVADVHARYNRNEHNRSQHHEGGRQSERELALSLWDLRLLYIGARVVSSPHRKLSGAHVARANLHLSR